MVKTSFTRGRLSIVTSFSNKIVEAMSGRAAFLAPSILIVPLSLLLPQISK